MFCFCLKKINQFQIALKYVFKSYRAILTRNDNSYPPSKQQGQEIMLNLNKLWLNFLQNCHTYLTQRNTLSIFFAFRITNLGQSPHIKSDITNLNSKTNR